jgi:hypothetical protein
MALSLAGLAGALSRLSVTDARDYVVGDRFYIGNCPANSEPLKRLAILHRKTSRNVAYRTDTLSMLAKKIEP